MIIERLQSRLAISHKINKSLHSHKKEFKSYFIEFGKLGFKNIKIVKTFNIIYWGEELSHICFVGEIGKKKYFVKFFYKSPINLYSVNDVSLPFFPRFYGSGMIGTHFYVVYEYFEGFRKLSSFWRRLLKKKDVIQLIDKILSIFNELEKRNISFNDINGTNMLYKKSKGIVTVKLCDIDESISYDTIPSRYYQKLIDMLKSFFPRYVRCFEEEQSYKELLKRAKS